MTLVDPECVTPSVTHSHTNQDTVLVFADKAKADAAWAKLDGDTVYGGVSRRTVKR
jgi:hypothetical protein